MDRELTELRLRVAALETALGALSQREQHVGRRQHLNAPMCAAALVTAAMALLMVATPASIRAAVPSSATAPFTVVDDSGHALMTVESTQGGGRLAIYSRAGGRVAEIQANNDGCCGRVGVYELSDPLPKVVLGVSQSDNIGLIQLAGVGKGMTQLGGRGLVVTNAQKNPVAILRLESDRGYFELRNSADAASAHLWASDVGGILQINEASGKPAVKIDAVKGPGKMTMFGADAAKTTVGVSADNAGLIMLNSANGNSMTLHGNGVLRTTNASGKDVVEMGVDPKANGILDVRGSAGVGGVRLDVSDTGDGNVKVHSPPFEIKAQIGTKGEKGDMCVMGEKGLICLSGVAIKTLIPW